MECRQPVDAFQLYRTLRRLNPAPYAAWLSFGGGPQVRPPHHHTSAAKGTSHVRS